jgi:hypothetical protein
MATQHADTAIESFRELELRLNEFLRSVPFEPAHHPVYSPVLASVLLDSCSLAESILKSTMDNPRYNGVANIAQHRVRRYAATPPYLNANDLRSVFRPDQFYAKKVWFIPRGDSSVPWYEWRANGTPRWWTAYNHVKHARFDNAHEATLGSTVHALKGLFLTLVQSLEFRDRLAERGIIRCRNLQITQLKTAAAAWEPLHTPETVLAVSALFGYKFLSIGSPAQATDSNVFV